MSRTCLAVVAALALVGLSGAAEDTPKAVPTVAKITGPFAHANLAIFLLHGADAVPDRDFLTLNEALEQKKIVVHETSDVNQLAVENTSDREVFIQSGDIVKGGKQDRLCPYDRVVPRMSGKMPLPSFCVEAGRWRQRGGESAAHFAMNANQAGKDLKLAANSSGGMGMGGAMAGGGSGIATGDGIGGRQRAVWSKVSEAQAKLDKSVGKSVMAGASPSSYQLSLEDKAVLAKLAACEKELGGLLKDKTDVIGVAYAVNGRVEGAEVFCSAALCGKEWPKMLKSFAVDALADFDEKKKFEPATVAQVEAFLKDATGPVKEVALTMGGRNAGQQAMNQAPDQPRQAGGQGGRPAGGQGAAQQRDDLHKPAEPGKPTVRIFQCDRPTSLMIESRDAAPSGAVLHRSYLRKDVPPEKKPGR